MNLSAEIANVSHDVAVWRRKRNLEYLAKLEARLAELKDQEALDIAANICQAEAERQDRLAMEGA